MKRTTKQAYEQIARRYAGDSPWEEDPVLRSRCRQCLIDALPGPRVLEVGCGPGTDSNAFAEAGLEVIATDICETFLEIVRERFPHIQCEQGDMRDLKYAPGCFDGIYGFACLVHLPREEVASTIAGFRRLLRQGGVLFLSMIRSEKHRDYIIEDWGGEVDNPMLFTCWEEEALEDVLRSAGFQEVQFHHFSSPYYEKMPRLLERAVSAYQVLAK